MARKTTTPRPRGKQKATPPARPAALLRRILRGALWILPGLAALVLVLRFVPPPTSAFMLARHAERLFGGSAGPALMYSWTPMETIPRHMALAVVAAEDQNFPRHFGFDVDAIARAVQHNERGKTVRGASTITQQVAKNLFLWSGRSYVRKALEAGLTVLIELLWTKERILEVYLNIAEFGDGTYGVKAAARRYFGTSPAGLDRNEAALLAAVLPNPRRLLARQPSPYVRERARWIRTQMRQLGENHVDFHRRRILARPARRAPVVSPGMLMAVGAYVSWGLLPVYWKLLKHVPTPELLSHRVAWSFVTLLAFLALSRRLAALGRRLDARIWRGSVLAALLIGVNWFTYVWSVNAGYIVEASLGYFITPLLSVLLGVFVLRERLRALQWLPLGLAAAGVVYLTVRYGRLPWIALILSSTFSLYGLVKKKSSLGAFEGLTMETGLLLLPALAWLGWTEFSGSGMFLRAGALSDLMLVGAGAATVAPLAMFAGAARRIPLSMIGVMQYIAPTLQFLLGIFLYREPFSGSQLIGFCMVWAALVLFLLERWSFSRALRHPA